MGTRPVVQKLRETIGRDFLGWYGTSSTFTRLRHDLIRSAAYHCLKPTAKLLLQDFVDYYERISNFDTDREIHRTGITYTYAMCNITISRSAFFIGMKQLKAKGFIKPHPKKLHRNGSAQVWIPSIAWKKYDPEGPELVLLGDYIRRRLESNVGAQQTSFDFVLGLETLDADKVAARKGGGNLAECIREQVASLAYKERLKAKYKT